MEKRRVFVDMDGTLCVWKPFVKSIEEIYQRGWFSSMKPQENVVKAVRSLITDSSYEVYVLTAVPDTEWSRKEKKQWLKEYMPKLKEENILFVDFRQPDKSKAVPGGIRPTDVLLDDYSANLVEWEKAGGIPVKLYNGSNGSNGTVWKHHCTAADWPADIVRIISATIPGPLVCLVGISGSGKSTVAEELEEAYGYKAVASYTDRKPRFEGEKGYTFVTPEEFDKLGDFCTYTEFDGHRDGTTAKQLIDCDLCVIDPDGIRFLQSTSAVVRPLVVVGLVCQPGTAVKRMYQRGDSDLKISKRISNDAKKFEKFEELCDILIDTEKFGPSQIADMIDAAIGGKEALV